MAAKNRKSRLYKKKILIIHLTRNLEERIVGGSGNLIEDLDSPLFGSPTRALIGCVLEPQPSHPCTDEEEQCLFLLRGSF